MPYINGQKKFKENKKLKKWEIETETIQKQHNYINDQIHIYIDILDALITFLTLLTITTSGVTYSLNKKFFLQGFELQVLAIFIITFLLVMLVFIKYKIKYDLYDFHTIKEFKKCHEKLKMKKNITILVLIVLFIYLCLFSIPTYIPNHIVKSVIWLYTFWLLVGIVSGIVTGLVLSEKIINDIINNDEVLKSINFNKDKDKNKKEKILNKLTSFSKFSIKFINHLKVFIFFYPISFTILILLLVKIQNFIKYNKLLEQVLVAGQGIFLLSGLVFLSVIIIEPAFNTSTLKNGIVKEFSLPLLMFAISISLVFLDNAIHSYNNKNYNVFTDNFFIITGILSIIMTTIYYLIKKLIFQVWEWINKKDGKSSLEKLKFSGTIMIGIFGTIISLIALFK